MNLINFQTSVPRYNTIRKYLEQKFSTKVHKITINTGIGCPNYNGVLDTRGCIFCNEKSYSPSIRNSNLKIDEQITREIMRVHKRHKDVSHYIAYLQAGTNTYISENSLKDIFDQILKHKSIVGISIGTRPDFVHDNILKVLEQYAKKTFIVVELGLQSIHQHSLEWLRRNHDYQCFLNTYFKIKQIKNIAVSAHIILGLPTETSYHMHQTAKELAQLKIDFVKLHNLYAAKDTELAHMFIQGKVKFNSLNEHVINVVDFIERLHPGCIIDRVSSDAPIDLILAPLWCLDRQAIQREINKEFEIRNSWQSKFYEE